MKCSLTNECSFFDSYVCLLTLSMQHLVQLLILVCQSGLAVQPNVDDSDRDRVFGLAENATADDSSQVRRTITMV